MKKVIISALLLILCGAVYGVYLYNKPSLDVQSVKADLLFNAAELIAENKLQDADIGKVIEISGTISVIEKSEESTIVILNDGIKCEILNAQNIEVGQFLTIKGIYSGFDEMFNEISLKKCYVITSK